MDGNNRGEDMDWSGDSSAEVVEIKIEQIQRGKTSLSRVLKTRCGTWVFYLRCYLFLNSILWLRVV